MFLDFHGEGVIASDFFSSCTTAFFVPIICLSFSFFESKVDVLLEGASEMDGGILWPAVRAVLEASAADMPWESPLGVAGVILLKIEELLLETCEVISAQSV